MIRMIVKMKKWRKRRVREKKRKEKKLDLDTKVRDKLYKEV